jgi:hypothetical protein
MGILALRLAHFAVTIRATRTTIRVNQRGNYQGVEEKYCRAENQK